MKLTNEAFARTRNWIYRNARPLDLARWQYHFEDGSAEKVLAALGAYQNEDGGFGHALEADSWNPNSSPIQTWAAAEILREVNVADRKNAVIQGILSYLNIGEGFACGVWQNAVPTNNDYPHAFWWTWNEDGLHYNPTANLCGFIIKYADRDSDLFSKGVSLAKGAVARFLSNADANEIGDGHLNLCYLRLLQYCEEAGGAELSIVDGVNERLLENINIDSANLDWCCDGVALEFLKTYEKNAARISNDADIVKKVCGYIIESQQLDGTWNIPWDWNDYETQWAVSKNWWKAYAAIGNMLFLKQCGCL